MEEKLKLRVVLIVGASVALLAPAQGYAHMPHHKPLSKMTLNEKKAFQQRVISHDQSVIRWFTKNASQVRTLQSAARSEVQHAVWWHRKQLAWTQRELR